MAITLTQLNTFLAVVRTGSVTGAAEELVVTQPSVSAAMSALAREVGASLVERDGRTVRLTPAGQAFAAYAADVVGLLEQGSQAAREASGAASRRLRIAAVTTAGEYIAPPLIQAFGSRHPDVEIELDVANRERVFSRLLAREADVAITGRPPAGDGLVGEPFVPNEIVLVTAADDPLARRREVAIGELARRPWLLREEGSGTRAMSEEFLTAHDLDPRRLTLGSNGAIKQAARAGLGVALQSLIAVELELEAGVLATVRVDARLPARHWYALRAAAGPVRRPVADFLAFLAGAELGPSLRAARSGERAAA